MGRRHLVGLFVLFVAVVSALAPCLSQAVQAQTYKHEPCSVLSGLAESRKSGREIAGWIWLAGGAAGLLALTAFGVPILGVIAGGVGGLGFFLNSLPSDAERLLAKSSDQQKDCYMALEQLSDSARNARYISAISEGVGGLFWLALAPGFLYPGLGGVAMATYMFLMPSEEEQAFSKVETTQPQGT